MSRRSWARSGRRLAVRPASVSPNPSGTPQDANHLRYRHERRRRRKLLKDRNARALIRNEGSLQHDWALACSLFGWQLAAFLKTKREDPAEAHGLLERQSFRLDLAKLPSSTRGPNRPNTACATTSSIPSRAPREQSGDVFGSRS